MGRAGVALAERFRVVRFDHRGHGGSPVPPGPYVIADLGRDVLALLDTLGVERASYCGLSIGGMAGMWLGAHAPERVERLALFCTSAHHPPAEAWAERAAAVQEAGSTEVVADAVVARWLTPGYASEHPEDVAMLRAMLTGTSSEGYAACCRAIERMDLRPDLPRIQAPTLVVTGAGPRHAARARRDDRRTVPGARLESLAPSAHNPAVERPGDVTALIRDHLLAGSLATGCHSGPN